MLTINLNELTENHKEWLVTLLKDASEDAYGTAKNEHLWALGANDNEQAVMHEMNSDEQRAYASLLHYLATKIEMGGND